MLRIDQRTSVWRGALLWGAYCLTPYAGVAQTVASSQMTVPAAYTPQVWDIDWSYLRDEAIVPGWSDRLHYIALGGSDAKFLAITGQIRERGEYQDHPAFGAQQPDNGYFQQRYLVSGDVHLGERLRLFAQLDSGLAELRDGGPRPGIDEDQADVNQAFVDLTPYRRGKDAVTLRAGRQLVSLGSTRLVAIGAGLNVEQPFDGFRLTANLGSCNVQGIALRPTLIKNGTFDNEPNNAEELWGLYMTRTLWGTSRVNVDAYYLGYDHKQARYTQGTGREQRETVGGRIWSHTQTWDYDFEYTGQFGRFGTGDIRAFGVGYHVGYTFLKGKFAPHPELNGGFLSGDQNPKDNRLSTFNPLFPNGNYLGQSILLGPYNLAIVRPTMKFNFSRKLSSNTNGEFLLRESLQDGVYNIVGIVTHPPNGSRERFIGSQIQQEYDYQFSRHLNGTLIYEHFFPGAFLKQSPPGRGVNFVSPQLTWNF